MTYAQADILAHADRWRGATITLPGGIVPPESVVGFRRGCCGAIRLRSTGRWHEMPSLAWVEGNPALDDVLTIRGPRGIVCELRRTP